MVKLHGFVIIILLSNDIDMIIISLLFVYDNNYVIQSLCICLYVIILNYLSNFII
jgi:hypothetical protein